MIVRWMQMIWMKMDVDEVSKIRDTLAQKSAEK
jgi:hypothetical protein